MREPITKRPECVEWTSFEWYRKKKGFLHNPKSQKRDEAKKKFRESDRPSSPRFLVPLRGEIGKDSQTWRGQATLNRWLISEGDQQFFVLKKGVGRGVQMKQGGWREEEEDYCPRPCSF